MDTFVEMEIGALNIKRLNFTKFVTDWDSLHKVLDSNYGRLDTFIYFRVTPANEQIFRELGRLACINRTDMHPFLKSGVIATRGKNLLLGIENTRKKLKHRVLNLERDE